MSSRARVQKDKNRVRASMGTAPRSIVGHVSANAEESRYAEIINNGAKKRITGVDIVMKLSSRNVDRGSISRGGKRWMGPDG